MSVLALSDLSHRARGRDALVRVRNRLEQAKGDDLARIADQLEKLAPEPTPEPPANTQGAAA